MRACSLLPGRNFSLPEPSNRLRHMIPSCETKLKHLRKRSDFVAMRGGQRSHMSSFVLQVRKRDAESDNCDSMRVGFTVTKKIGNAVVRNRIKRRLRQVAKCSLSTDGAPGHDYVLIGKHPSLGASFDVLVNDLRKSLKKIHRAASKPPAKKYPNQAGNENGQ